MIEDIPKNSTLSSYQPSKEVCEITKHVKEDYHFGHSILTRPWIELNDRSVIDDENRGQLMFNAFVDIGVEDPAEAWKWRGTRSKARNKGIGMHANLTGNYLMPSYVAQNEDDEVDEEFSEIMRDGIEWMCSPTVSNYQPSFLQVVFGMMTNPVTYLSAEYVQTKQTIKERAADGSISKKDVVDDVLSGFNAPIYSSSQVLITNAYERDTQRQRALIKRRWVDKDELKAKYGEHPNWDLVKPGWKSMYNVSDGLFYDIKDIQHPNLVEEVVWENRRQDSGIPFLGGIYFGDMDDVEANPILHRDNKGKPKYNVTPFGYSRIGEHFFYYKSMMNVVGWDHMLYDAMSELVMNRAILDVDPPYAVSGSDKIDSEMVFPKAIVTFEDPKTKVTPLLPPSNLNTGFTVLNATGESMSEESIDPISMGAMPNTRQQAYTIATIQANAKKIIGEVAKQLAISVAGFGDLMKDIFINHITAPEVEELLGGTLRLKYKSIVLENKEVGGQSVHKKIAFDQTLIGTEMTDAEKTMESLKLLEESGWPNKKQAIVRANPELFSKFTYLSRADPEEMFAKDNEYWKPILTNLYTTLKGDPTVDSEWLLKQIGRAFFNSRGSALVRKTPAQAPGTPPTPPAGGANPMGNMAQMQALSTALPARP